jgi:lysophospholipase L1-like esterase
VNFSLKKNVKSGYASFRLYRTARQFAGQNFTIHVRLKGKGEASFLFDGGKESEKITVQENWKNYVFNIKAPAVDRLTLRFGLHGEASEVQFDDLSVHVLNQDTVIVGPVGALPVAPGSKVPEQTFRVYPHDVKGEFIHYRSASKQERITRTPSLMGKATYRSFTAGQEGFHRIAYTSGGASAIRDFVITPQEEINVLEAAAKKVDLKGKPMRILYLADSLSDNDRDHNHASLTAGLLDKFNPGMVTYRNAGVGGDQIGRIFSRLKSRGGYRGYVYDALWDEQYDLIIIFVGQNDTVAFKETNFSKPQIPITEVDKRMRSIISKIRKNSDARIVLVSGVCTPVNTLSAYHFGVPELVNAYNAAIKKIADELELGYIDLYTPLQAVPEAERVKLFRPDRVHLSPAGHLFVAEEYLKYLGK